MSISSTNLAMQGFKLNADEQSKLAFPIRFAPIMCMTLTAIFTFLQHPMGLYITAAIAGSAAILPRHPFDYLYMGVLNPILKTGIMPKSTPQRRFSCGFGALMLGVAGHSFATGDVFLGNLLGYGFVVLVIPMITIHFCMASLMYNYIPGMPGRWDRGKGAQGGEMRKAS